MSLLTGTIEPQRTQSSHQEMELTGVQPQQRVRGIIIAREVTEGLRTACGQLNDVSLFEYELSISIKRA